MTSKGTDKLIAKGPVVNQCDKNRASFDINGLLRLLCTRRFLLQNWGGSGDLKDLNGMMPIALDWQGEIHKVDRDDQRSNA